jgi:sugar O-acyltransferase (sialic acid O-acetyltransferase NeuD family)
MLIIGTGGLVGQMFDDLVAMNDNSITFWSETESSYHQIQEKFNIISTDDEVINYFKNISTSFLLCVGGLESRKKLLEKFTNLGGEVTTFISPGAVVSPYGTSLGKGCIVLSLAEIESHVTIGENCLFNKYAKIGHGSVINNNCEIAPDALLLGEVIVGEGAYIGTRALILPKVKIGRNATVAAGATVKKNVPDNAVVSGEFASVKLIKK